MIISLITGGTGSEQIQYGLYSINPHIELNLIINGYDDGKSTGVLRRLFPGTLGISDFRKNQILEYKIRYGNNNIYNILNYRFTTSEPYKHCINLVESTDINIDIKDFFIENLNYFFSLNQSKQIIYDDFSFMNIIYCSLLYKNDSDMEYVCKIIKNILGLKNTIYLNSNKNLNLRGITAKKQILIDENAIVTFQNVNDKIVDIYYDDNYPILNKNTADILYLSDIIIFSCGTQFSSLIPTYKTLGFKDIISQSKAKKFLLLNCEYDNDIINYNGDELLDKINEYLPLDNIYIIISDSMINNLYPTKNNYNYINIPQLIHNKKHDGFILWKYIFTYYFKPYFNDNYLFDYDYTLFDKNNLDISYKNIKLLQNIDNPIIVTNNCISNILEVKDIYIYSNMGAIMNYNNSSNIINNDWLLNDIDIRNIQHILTSIKSIDKYTIENRRNISIAIKPVINRDVICEEINCKITRLNYEAIKTGRTTIEIIKKGVSKRNLFINNSYLDKSYTYITDENDIEYDKSIDTIKYLQVNNILTTNIFLQTLILNEKYDICIIVGGINSRMEITYPKCLIEIDNVIVLKKIIDQVKPYANNIYICGNMYYKDKFVEFENTLLGYTNIIFLYFNSIDHTQRYPKGNGDTIYQLLQSVKLTQKVFIMWGDVILSNNKIFEEMYNMQYNTEFLLPVNYEKDPYAYLHIEDNRIKCIEYKKNKSISYGFHDQCIFLCNTDTIKIAIEKVMQQQYCKEYVFLDVIKYIENVSFFQTHYCVKSFNTISELTL